MTQISESLSYHAVVACEDFSAGQRAKDTFHRLIQDRRSPGAFISNLWKFDVLRKPRAKEIAAQEAMQANMIIISARAEIDLPSEVKNWLEAWLRNPASNNRTLVALLARDRGSLPLSPIQEYLERVARQAKLEFYSITVDVLEEPVDLSPETMSQRAEKKTAVLEGILHHPSIFTRLEPLNPSAAVRCDES